MEIAFQPQKVSLYKIYGFLWCLIACFFTFLSWRLSVQLSQYLYSLRMARDICIFFTVSCCYAMSDSCLYYGVYLNGDFSNPKQERHF